MTALDIIVRIFKNFPTLFSFLLTQQVMTYRYFKKITRYCSGECCDWGRGTVFSTESLH